MNIKNIIRETIEEYIDNVSYDSLKNDSHNLPIVYQLAKSDRIASIFRNGYDREYAGTAGGNFYVTGVYSTYNLQSTLNNLGDKASLYGDTIVKLGIKSYERFFIMNYDIAKKVYGKNYLPENQLKILFGNNKEVYNKIINSKLYKNIISTTNHYTSHNVQALLESLDGMRRASDQTLRDCDVRGFVFYGANDGHVAIIMDFKAIVPLAYSKDKGKTWKKELFSQKTIENTVQTHDALTLLGKDAKSKGLIPISKFINGAIIVQDKRTQLYNLYTSDKKLISDYWFEQVSPFDSKGRSLVKIKFDDNLELIKPYLQATYPDDYEEMLDYLDDKTFNYYIDKYGYFYEKQNDKYPINMDKQPVNF